MTSSRCYLAGKITTYTSFELDVKTMAYLILMSVSKLKFWMTAISRSLKCLKRKGKGSFTPTILVTTGKSIL